MKDRIRALRRLLNLTQQEFADRIGIKRNTMANYETGRNAPVDSVLSLICREFNVNEDWLRYGEGDMFIPDIGDELDALARKHNLVPGIKEFIRKIIDLPPDDQKTIMNFMVSVVSGFEKVTPDPKGPEEMSIDEKVAAYRDALEKEREAAERSQAS